MNSVCNKSIEGGIGQYGMHQDMIVCCAAQETGTPYLSLPCDKKENVLNIFPS